MCIVIICVFFLQNIHVVYPTSVPGLPPIHCLPMNNVFSEKILVTKRYAYSVVQGSRGGYE